MPEIKCHCDDWRDNMPQIVSAFQCPGVVKYTGKHFSHCPWCGAGLLSRMNDSDVNIVSMRCPECLGDGYNSDGEWCAECEGTGRV